MEVPRRPLPCREFDVVNRDDGYEYRITEMACRRANGSREIQSRQSSGSGGAICIRNARAGH